MSEDQHAPPGSDTARRNGCTCNPRLNRDGNGAGENGKGEPLFVVNKTCKLHKETP